MIRAIAIDDEPPALRVITRFCEQVDFIDLQKTFSRTDQALGHLAEFPVDLLFLDINMPAVSGIDFYRMVSSSAELGKTMVIFTTAYAEHAVEGFNLSAVDYLLKPFTFERFLQAVNRASEYHAFLHAPGSAKPTYVYIRADYRLHKIALADILFIEGLDDYLKIHLQNSKPVVTRMTMKSMLQKLAETDEQGEGFMRVHRSYIIPVSRLEAIRNKTVLVAGQEIPIGASYEEDFFKRFTR
ncbi:LytR/AlgR family response regulator transcription factor [Spirosoma koreense]